MTNRSENRRRLWYSLEMGVMRRDLLLYTLVIILTLMLASCRHGTPGQNFGSILQAVLAAVFLIPVFGFYLIRGYRILRKPEAYIFCRCTLSQPHYQFFTKTMYFTVLIPESEERKRIRNTHAIFAPHGIMSPVMEDYVNSTVTIAYNPETEMVVVIG